MVQFFWIHFDGAPCCPGIACGQESGWVCLTAGLPVTTSVSLRFRRSQFTRRSWRTCVMGVARWLSCCVLSGPSSGLWSNTCCPWKCCAINVICCSLAEFRRFLLSLVFIHLFLICLGMFLFGFTLPAFAHLQAVEFVFFIKVTNHPFPRLCFCTSLFLFAQGSQRHNELWILSYGTWGSVHSVSRCFSSSFFRLDDLLVSARSPYFSIELIH